MKTFTDIVEMIAKKKATEAIIQRSGDTKVGEETEPKTEKEKRLARMAPPHDKITHADVMVGRGVKKEEASPMIKPPKNEFGTKEDAFAHTRKHGGKVMMKTSIHPTTGVKTKSYVVKEQTELDEAHQVVAKTKEGETFKSGIYPTKKQAMDMHYKMAKSNKYAKVDTVKVQKENQMKKEANGVYDKSVAVPAMEHYLDAINGKTTFSDVVYEKKLTPAELKKREEVAQAIERDNPEMPMDKKMAIATATAKKVAEEAEELDEVSKQTLGSYIKKATADTRNLDKKAKSSKDLADKSGRNSFDVLSKIQSDRAEKRMKGISKATDRLTKEEVEELDEANTMQMAKEIEAYAVKSGGIDKADMMKVAGMLKRGDMKGAVKYAKTLDTDPKEYLMAKMGLAEEAELNESHFSLGDKVECIKSGMTGTVTKLDKDHGEDDEKYYTVKTDSGKVMKYAPNELRLVKEDVDLDEAMISYSDFMDKIAMHRKAGNKVVDHKYSGGKAHYTTVDNEGHGRKVTHTPSGQKVEKLGKISGEDDEAAEVKPTEKRGRGRPAGSKSGGKYKR